MNIGDRIQTLRKAKGISQEELADKIGVSRQAVSKWESEQSTPDIVKIILLSDYFETTTDYLLKGIEPTKESGRRIHATLFTTAGTILNAIGLASALAIWVERQTAYAAGIGIILMLIGTGVFLTGQLIDSIGKAKAAYYFILSNVWLLLPVPLACCFSAAAGLICMIRPFPLLFARLLYWIVYIAVCVMVDIAVVRKNKLLTCMSRSDTNR
ncbi:MAG: helix-turn-helix domain-containing protein [Lachnospiraceae bacterium]|nr:helix-turn-helix domain-containing protein [Lachnospiraceae bacterium]